MRVFISYHNPDGAVAHAVEDALALQRPGTECYLALRRNIAGAYWLARLADEISASDAVLFLAGPRIGPWQELEYYEALRLSRSGAGRPRLVPVVMASPAPGLPFFAQLHQIFATEPTAPDAIAAILRALDESLPETEERWRHFQPYKGLPALEEADAAFLFGRESETATILELLAQRPDRIIALVGQSGVGKSSLVRAGIIARLKSQAWPLADAVWPGALANSRAFLPLLVRPGDQPLKELARAFAQLYETSPAEINRETDSWATQLASGTRLRDVLHAARDRVAQALGADPPSRFVLYIDQAEELYAEGNAESAGRFSHLLAEAAEHEAFSVLLSLRSDYYPQYQNDGDLFAASERVDILPLTQAVLTEIVRKPAETLGARFESGDMVQHVVAATEREAGALPLLSDLMHDVWLRMLERGDGVLRWSDGPDIVDVAAPLRRRAEAFLAEHEGEAASVRRLFALHLALVPKAGEPMRRRARQSECEPVEWHLAETLANERWRLLSLTGGADEEPTVEVAHEQLLRRWPRLSGWLEEEREFLVWRGQVEEDVAEPDPELLTGRRLAVARLWFERRHTDLPPDLRKFVAASIADDDARVAAERRRRRAVLGATAAGLVVALALAAVAGWQWRVATIEKAEADRQRVAAQHSLALATTTANGLISYVQKFRDRGVPAPVIKQVLDQVVKVQDELAQGGQGSPDLQRSRAEALVETSNALLTLGDTNGALATAQKSRAIWKALLSGAPDSTDHYGHERTVGEVEIGDVLQAQGNRLGALAAYRGGLAIARELAQKDPSNTDYQHDLSVTNTRIGIVLQAQGDLAGALVASGKGRAIAEAVLQKDPGDTEARHDLLLSHQSIGDVLRAQGNLACALAAYGKGRAIAEALARMEPDNTKWQNDLWVIDNNIGDVLLIPTQGDLVGALTAYGDGLAIATALAQEDRGNTDYQRDLSVSHTKIGNALHARGDLPGALAAYRKGLAIRTVLVQMDQGNTEWRHDLSVSDKRIGDVLQAQGDLPQARAAYHDGFAIARALAQKDPGNVQWQTDLVGSLYNLATVGDAPKANLTQALTILKRLDAAGKLTAEQKGWIATIQAALAKAS
jgi:tetratricopeptide (TPR) repeat protein